MGVFVQHEPCPVCGSRDNLARYADGSGFCFGCQHHEKATGEDVQPVERTAKPFTPVVGEFEPLRKRRISKETCSHFGYRVGYHNGEPVQIADYFNAKGRRCAQKLRTPTQKGLWVGDARAATLFGQQRASAATAHTVYVTEGEIDALSLSQVLGNDWPVVSIKSGAKGARKDLESQLDWLDTFREIVLVFDADEHGDAAALDCAELVPHKTKIARLPRKDANEMLVAGEVAELLQAVRNATPYRPDGIRCGIELLDEILVPPAKGLSYPWACLDEKTHGMRRQEMVTWCAGTGSGKSQVLREITRHLMVTHGEKVGVIALEESNRHTTMAQVSLELNLPIHIPEVRDRVTDEEIVAAAHRVLPSIYVYNHWGSVDADSILPKIRYMAHALGVKWIILDHLSIMVSGNATDGDERKRIDEIMTRSRALVQELDIGFHLVTHLRRSSGVPFEEGGRPSLSDLRGSGGIGQISDIAISLERDQQATDEKKHMTLLRVLKNRFSGECGETGHLVYSPATGRLSEAAAFAPVADDAAPKPQGDF